MRHPASTPRWQPALVWAAVAGALAAVFAAYLDPHLAVELATRAWSCF